MTLLFVLLAACLVAAILVLTFLGGAQHLGGTDDPELARTVTAYARTNIGPRRNRRV